MTLLISIAVSEIKAQSVQLSVEVVRSISGIENDGMFYSDPGSELRFPESFGSVTGRGLAGCVAIGSKENIPVIVSAELLHADQQPGEKRQKQLRIGYINDGGQCSTNPGSMKTISISTSDNQVSFRLDQSPRTVRNLHVPDGVVKGYVMVLTPADVSGSSEEENMRHSHGQEGDAVIKIDIEYL